MKPIIHTANLCSQILTFVWKMEKHKRLMDLAVWFECLSLITPTKQHRPPVKRCNDAYLHGFHYKRYREESNKGTCMGRIVFIFQGHSRVYVIVVPDYPDIIILS